VLLDVVIAVYLMKTLIPVHRHPTPLLKEHLLRNTEMVRYVSVFRVTLGYSPACTARLLTSLDQASSMLSPLLSPISLLHHHVARGKCIIFNLTGDEDSSVYESVTKIVGLIVLVSGGRRAVVNRSHRHTDTENRLLAMSVHLRFSADDDNMSVYVAGKVSVRPGNKM